MAPAKASPRRSFWQLTLGSIGVVYGDIGTSPLYALREAVAAATGTGASMPREAVLGVLSLILWALIIIVTFKYVLISLARRQPGEGGTLALMALAQGALGRRAGVMALCGIVSAALFYGDSMITPALSVLSAIEGLKVATPAFDPYIVPLTVLILVVLFAVQSTGTAKVAAFFGPITTLWFLCIGIPGLLAVIGDPEVLFAFNPLYGVRFLAGHGMVGLFTLGAVFLAVTGAEALYADLGHFGRKPIQTAWVGLVLPSLALNYLGQGALVLADPKAIENPFFLLYPDWALLPMVVLATVATVIASQAVITGAYSITQQAIQLGLLPRLEIRHTSEAQYGQIYMPRVNWFLLVGVLLLVALFRSSSALPPRDRGHGNEMVVTGVMAFVVIRNVWNWSWMATAALMLPFLFIDLTFLGANLLKVIEGGWVPLAFGGLVMVVMYTWRRGTRLLLEKTRRQEIPLNDLVRMLEKKPPLRVPGTAVFLTSTPASAPTALMHSLKHYKVLHEHNVILTIETEQAPKVETAERVAIERVEPDLHAGAAALRFHGDAACTAGARHNASWVGHSTSCRPHSFCPAARQAGCALGMPRWQDHLFIMLARMANTQPTISKSRPSERGGGGNPVTIWKPGVGNVACAVERPLGV